ncbi:hypothetical protein ADL26_15265, partial [Thermoactinomyces vulgaris]
LEHVVAQPDGLAHRLDADGDVGQARDGQGPGDGAGGDDDLVVLDLAGGADERLHGELALGVVDLGDRTGEDGAELEGLSERHDAVTRGDGASGRLGQERLVGHVLVGVDDHQFNLTALDVAL